MDYSNLSEIQMDAIQEICSIASGNAATALSLMLNKKIDMSVPNVSIVPFESIVDESDVEDVSTAVLVRIDNDAPGYVLIVFDKEATFDIISSLSLEKQEGGEELSEMDVSILAETGNILSSSFMIAISQMTEFKMLPSVPVVAHDLLSAILSSIFIESGQYGDFVLQLETKFVTEGSKVNGHFYFIPIDDSLEKILKALGVN